jgi:hypothetical protein
MAGTEWPWGYGMPVPDAAWPDFTQRWLGGEYPSGRPSEAAPPSGWKCPGCQRCHAPSVPACRFCGPDAHASPDRCGPPREGGMCACEEGG